MYIFIFIIHIDMKTWDIKKTCVLFFHGMDIHIYIFIYILSIHGIWIDD